MKFVKDNMKKIAIIVAVLAVIGVFGGYQYFSHINQSAFVSYEQYKVDLINGRIDTIYYDSSKNTMEYTLLNDTTEKMSFEERQKYHYRKSEYRRTDFVGGENFRENTLKYGVHIVERKGLKVETILSLMGLCTSIVMLVLFRKLTSGNDGADKGKKKEPLSEVRFDDVIGHDEIVEDLQQMVRYMKNSKDIKERHGRIPKGVLLVGPPGTGKTMLAKAMATEADVPFLYREASSFIDRFVGVGPRNIRQLFKEARKKAPCIVFIDEIDAVANDRNLENNSEDRRTVNALLTELDGFDSEHQILVIGATNSESTLDPAVTRAGRFDRKIQINPPRDAKIRKKLLEHYLKNVKVEEDLDLKIIAREIGGFTGADIAAVVNEAILISVANREDEVKREHIEEAIDKHLLQGNHLKKEQLEEDRKLIAYHEAGHAVMSHLFQRRIARINIESNTSGVGGFVLQEDTESCFQTKREMEEQIYICYAGRISEEIFFGRENCTNGAANDIENATKMLRQYIVKYGFSDTFGMNNLDILQGQGNLFDNETVLREVIETSKRMEKCTRMHLEKNKEKIRRLAESLLEQDTLSGDEVEQLMER